MECNNYALMKQALKTVEIVIEDPVLSHLVREQLSHFASAEIVDAGGDLVVSDKMPRNTAPHLLLGVRSDSHESFSLPLRLGELTDRLRYMLSGRERFALGDAISFGDFQMSADGVISKGAHSLRLTEKERLILQSLYQAEEHSLDRKNLLQKVWGYAESAETHTLETHLYRLRQKLEEGFGVQDLIITKDGVYTLNL